MTAADAPTEATRSATKVATKAASRTKLQQRSIRSARFVSGKAKKPRVAAAANAGSLEYAKLSVRRGYTHGTCGHHAGHHGAHAGRHNRWYIVKRGDTLWRIARTHYKDGNKYRLLLNANPGIRSREGMIMPCQHIVIPRTRKN
jgi:nucleoid-associated protein YgaU